MCLNNNYFSYEIYVGQTKGGWGSVCLSNITEVCVVIIGRYLPVLNSSVFVDNNIYST